MRKDAGVEVIVAFDYISPAEKTPGSSSSITSLHHPTTRLSSPQSIQPTFSSFLPIMQSITQLSDILTSVDIEVPQPVDEDQTRGSSFYCVIC